MSGMSNLNNTVRKCVCGGAITGAGACIGGLVGGPVGMCVGGAIGAGISASTLEFRSAPDVVRNDFTPNERRDLLERVCSAVSKSKEALIRFLVRVLQALLRCGSKRDLIETVLKPILRELTEVGIRSLVQYLSA